MTNTEITPNWGSAENIKQIETLWTGYAKGSAVKVSYLAGAYYGIAEELAALRVWKQYNQYGHNANTRVFESKGSLGTGWVISLEVA